MQFTVDEILADSPASYSQIQIGDRLRMVSSACDESASAAQSAQASRIRRRRKKREKVGWPTDNKPPLPQEELLHLRSQEGAGLEAVIDMLVLHVSVG